MCTELTDLRIGDEVYWTDPDNDFSSGYYTIANILGEIYLLTNEAGTELEAFNHELS